MLKLFSAGVVVTNLLTGFLLACLVQNLQSSQKQSAARHCNCTIADVENALAKFIWAREAHKKIEKLKEEGKPMPKNLAEVLHALVCFDSQMRFTHNTRKLLCAYIYAGMVHYFKPSLCYFNIPFIFLASPKILSLLCRSKN